MQKYIISYIFLKDIKRNIIFTEQNLMIYERLSHIFNMVEENFTEANSVRQQY